MTTDQLEELFDASVRTAPFLDPESVMRRAIDAIALLTEHATEEPQDTYIDERIVGSLSLKDEARLVAWSRKHGWSLIVTRDRNETTILSIWMLSQADRPLASFSSSDVALEEETSDVKLVQTISRYIGIVREMATMLASDPGASGTGRIVPGRLPDGLDIELQQLCRAFGWRLDMEPVDPEDESGISDEGSKRIRLERIR